MAKNSGVVDKHIFGRAPQVEGVRSTGSGEYAHGRRGNDGATRKKIFVAAMERHARETSAGKTDSESTRFYFGEHGNRRGAN